MRSGGRATDAGRAVSRGGDEKKDKKDLAVRRRNGKDLVWPALFIVRKSADCKALEKQVEKLKEQKEDMEVLIGRMYELIEKR